jgi:hypothetical protein
VIPVGGIINVSANLETDFVRKSEPANA